MSFAWLALGLAAVSVCKDEVNSKFRLTWASLGLGACTSVVRGATRETLLRHWLRAEAENPSSISYLNLRKFYLLIITSSKQEAFK